MTRAPENVDILVRHGYVVTMDADDRVIADGAIAIRGRDILEVGPDSELAARYTATTVVDAGGAPVHPGLVETHVHTTYHLYRGVVPDDMDEDDVFPRFTRGYLDEVQDRDEYLAVQLAAIEMLRNGTTTFVEAGSVFAADEAARAAETVGIRAVLADPFIMDQPSGFIWDMAAGGSGGSSDSGSARSSREPQDHAQALERLGTQLWRNADPDALVTGHIALRGLGTASPELIAHSHALAVGAGAVLNMHHAYADSDHEAVTRMFSAEPVEGLARLGVLGPGLLLSHANVLSERETALLLESGTGISWAPAASMIWGHSVVLRSAHARFWRAGGSLGLGSDSSNWSNVFDLFRQLQLAIMLSRTIEGDRAALGSMDALRIATMGGARAAGLGDRIGSLETGKRADLVIHSAARPEAFPTLDPVRNLVYAAGSKTVGSVIVDGRLVLHDGSLRTVDERTAFAELDDAARALLGRTGFRVTADRSRRV